MRGTPGCVIRPGQDETEAAPDLDLHQACRSPYKTTVRGLFEFDQSILEKLKNAKRIYLDFENDDDDSIEVQTPKAGEVLGALKFCEQNRK